MNHDNVYSDSDVAGSAYARHDDDASACSTTSDAVDNGSCRASSYAYDYAYAACMSL